jgi:hypothetical protein
MSDSRRFGITRNHVRMATGVGVVLGSALLIAQPALAFEPAANEVIRQTCAAFRVAKNVLITAAVLAVIVGLAPMLWGQVKVKWVISSLVACTLFGVVPSIVLAFASGAGGQPCS